MGKEFKKGAVCCPQLSYLPPSETSCTLNKTQGWTCVRIHDISSVLLRHKWSLNLVAQWVLPWVVQVVVWHASQWTSRWSHIERDPHFSSLTEVSAVHCGVCAAQCTLLCFRLSTLPTWNSSLPWLWPVSCGFIRRGLNFSVSVNTSLNSSFCLRYLVYAGCGRDTPFVEDRVKNGHMVSSGQWEVRGNWPESMGKARRKDSLSFSSCVVWPGTTASILLPPGVGVRREEVRSLTLLSHGSRKQSVGISTILALGGIKDFCIGTSFVPKSSSCSRELVTSPWPSA